MEFFELEVIVADDSDPIKNIEQIQLIRKPGLNREIIKR